MKILVTDEFDNELFCGQADDYLEQNCYDSELEDALNEMECDYNCESIEFDGVVITREEDDGLWD